MQKLHGGNIYRAAREKNLDASDIIDFSASINPLGLSPRFKKYLPSCENAILNYPDQDAHDFIAALSDHHGLPPENILAGNGSTDFIYMLPSLIRPKSVLVVAPSFTEFEHSYQRAKGILFYFVTREKDGFEISKKALLGELKRGYSALYLCNPASPSGVLTSAGDMDEIIGTASRKGTCVILDEAFIDFHEGASKKDLVRNNETLLILRSMTKFFALPGLRAGYLLSHQKNIDKIRDRQEPWSINAVAQQAAVESLSDTAYIHKTVEYVKEARKAFAAELKKVPHLKLYPGQANFLLLRLKDSAPVSSAELYDRLLDRGLLIRTCGDFHGLDETFIRIAVKKKNENKKLVTELKKILR